MKISVWYHGILSTPIQDLGDRPVLLFCEQMAALNLSGLVCAADEMHIGMNDKDVLLAGSMAPDKAVIHPIGNGSFGEQPTLELLREWLKTHKDWAVCYHHMKAVTHPPNDVYSAWRRCLERCVIWNWKGCLKTLELGYDTAGGHWKTHEDQRYWAGNFWWATASHLLKLPPIPSEVINGRSYESEVWIGKCRGFIRRYAFADHKLMSGCAQIKYG